MRGRCALTFSLLAICGLMLAQPVLADYKNFGVYQDSNADGVLNSGDTYLGGVMSWLTFYSAGTSYNYSDHDDPALAGFDDLDLTGAPYGANQANDDVLSWLPMDDDELHIYMVWARYDNEVDEDPQDPDAVGNKRDGFSLGMIANDYIRGRSDDSPSGGYGLDIAVRNDDTSIPQVTLSDDYFSDVHPDGRPPVSPDPAYKENASQELWKIADPDLVDPYNHYFQGRWDYTASTADGGVIGGIHNGDYDISINLLTDIVTSVVGDGLVIRIDPLYFDEVDKIVIYDFGYAGGAVDTLGNTPPAGYDEFSPTTLEIPLGTAADKTFFIASIPAPEPSGLLSLLILAGAVVLRRRPFRS